jgi:hypothetical protein
VAVGWVAIRKDPFMFEQAFRNIDDVLRKEAGCTTELDYTEQSSWLLFLKYLAGLEEDKATEAALDGKKYSYILDQPYRWETWAAPRIGGGKDGQLDHNAALTGDDLRDFVNGKLFPYLMAFKARATGPNTIEYKIGQIFGEIKNKIQSGYNLREIIDYIDELRFRSQTEKYELSHLYEAKIKNMGNAPAHSRHHQRRPAEDRRENLRRRVRLGGFLVRIVRLSDEQGQTQGGRLASPPDAHVLRQGKEVPRLCHRHHEHDPAWHRGAEHHPHQHAV